MGSASNRHVAAARSDTCEKEEAQQSGIIEHGSFHLLSVDRVKIELKNCLKNHFSQLFGRQTKCFMAFPIHSEPLNCLGLSTVLSCMKSKLRWKASLLERRQREATTLSEEDVEFLVINTRFGVEDIREWYRQFILECPQVGKYTDSAALQIV